jgi:hypothetical protein
MKMLTNDKATELFNHLNDKIRAGGPLNDEDILSFNSIKRNWFVSRKDVRMGYVLALLASINDVSLRGASINNLESKLGYGGELPSIKKLIRGQKSEQVDFYTKLMADIYWGVEFGSTLLLDTTYKCTDFIYRSLKANYGISHSPREIRSCVTDPMVRGELYSTTPTIQLISRFTRRIDNSFNGVELFENLRNCRLSSRIASVFDVAILDNYYWNGDKEFGLRLGTLAILLNTVLKPDNDFSGWYVEPLEGRIREELGINIEYTVETLEKVCVSIIRRTLESKDLSHRLDDILEKGSPVDTVLGMDNNYLPPLSSYITKISSDMDNQPQKDVPSVDVTTSSLMDDLLNAYLYSLPSTVNASLLKGRYLWDCKWSGITLADIYNVVVSTNSSAVTHTTFMGECVQPHNLVGKVHTAIVRAVMYRVARYHIATRAIGNGIDVDALTNKELDELFTITIKEPRFDRFTTLGNTLTMALSFQSVEELSALVRLEVTPTPKVPEACSSIIKEPEEMMEPIVIEKSVPLEEAEEGDLITVCTVDSNRLSDERLGGLYSRDAMVLVGLLTTGEINALTPTQLESVAPLIKDTGWTIEQQWDDTNLVFMIGTNK